MRTASRWPVALSGALLISYSPAGAAAFYPEKAPPVTAKMMMALGAKTVEIDGRTQFQVDDMLFSPAEIPSRGTPGRRWPKARLIYDAGGLTPEQLQRFRDGCAMWARRTRIRCVPRTKETGGYVEITAGEGHGSSTVGYPGRDSVSHLTLLETPYKVAHEIGHALGMTHEHMRPDRADYVEIKWDNIKAGARSQFRWRMKLDVYGPYDFLSVMHYTQDNYSKNGQPTIVVLPPNEKFQTVIGTVLGPSELDIAGMNQRYP